MIRALAAVLLLACSARAAEPARVSLREAVAAAIGSRLDAVAAGERSAQARARAMQGVAALLPQLTASVSETRTFKVNLAAQGLDFPGFPSLLGPFNTFDARLRLTQKLFDPGAIRRSQAGRATARAAGAEERAAREQVAAAAALAYLEALRAQRAVLAARADKKVTGGLLTLSRDRKEQGSATGLDIVRAQARDAASDAAVLRAEVDEREALLMLKRVAGWPFEREIALTDDFTAAASTAPLLDASLSEAFSGRAEIVAAEERARAEELAAKGAFDDRLPSVVLTGDYAKSGALPSDAKSVGAIGGAVSLPIFSGGLLKGRQTEAESRHREALAGLEDARRQVEFDVRTALERLAETAQEERAAALSLSLGERELEIVQHRYAAGVGASIDLIVAQAELARARSAEVSTLARYHSSRVNYAAAVGRASEFSL
jgi:outer membrane protein